MNNNIQNIESALDEFSIVIVAENEFFRKGIRGVLEANPNYSVLRCFANMAEFLASKDRYNPDLFIVGGFFDLQDSLSIIEYVKKRTPLVKVLAILDEKTESAFDQIIRKGTEGVVLNTISVEDLKRAVRLVCDDKTFFSEELLPYLTKRFTGDIEKLNDVQFSKREREVLSLVAKGCSSHEIGEKLNISAKTVNNHRANLNAKAGVKNTAGLISFAMKNGLVDFS